MLKRYEGPSFELFSLKADLSESRDLAGELPDKVKELDAVLAKWLKDTGAKLPRKAAG